MPATPPLDGAAHAAHRPGRLAGRRVLITGASRGIGRAIALRCSQEGALLFITATHAAKLEETRAEAAALGAPVTAHIADVAEPAQVSAMVAAAEAAMGGIDVLVNNAGVYLASRLVDVTPEAFDRVMKVNVYGAFQVMQQVLRGMQGRAVADVRSNGKVINIASTAGRWGSMNQSVYNASKHALVGFTRCAALEMGASRIQVNAICPGFVETDMLGEFRAHADILGVPFEQIMANGLARVPLKRFLQPGEIADLAVFLASSESDGMTGQSLLIDGGMLMV